MSPGQDRRMCTNSAKTFLNIESCFLNPNNACQSTGSAMHNEDWEPIIVKNAVICGSEGEVGSDSIVDPVGPKFFLFGHHANLVADSLYLQIKAVAYTIFLSTNDQLRQRYEQLIFTFQVLFWTVTHLFLENCTIVRMAFALSQILVITPNQIDSDDREAEIFLQYYDIFVRHAFGNYRDILKEVAYSPMMVSRSTSFSL